MHCQAAKVVIVLVLENVRVSRREREIIHSDLLKVNGSTGVSMFREAGGDLQTKYMHAQGVAWHV